MKMQHEVVSREEWLKRRIALLEQEKAVTKLRDLVCAERLRLPWVRVETDYVFDGPDGKQSLSDLFRGRSQLYVKHFMMGPGTQTQCVGCSLEVDHMTDLLPHLENHDVSYAVIARAPIDEIEVVRKRMGWKVLWVSSFSNDFNYDFNVSFRSEEIATGRATYNYGHTQEWMAQIQDLSGRSVFYKNDAGEIFHTYSAYGRGGEDVLGIYAILDSMPKGRNETIQHALCDWARPRNMYGKGGTTEPNGRYHAPACGCSAHGR
jgi:predicted dithiol-disulfide oxidoreductase (DUF899 family)